LIRLSTAGTLRHGHRRQVEKERTTSGPGQPRDVARSSPDTHQRQDHSAGGNLSARCPPQSARQAQGLRHAESSRIIPGTSMGGHNAKDQECQQQCLQARGFAAHSHGYRGCKHCDAQRVADDCRTEEGSCSRPVDSGV